LRSGTRPATFKESPSTAIVAFGQGLENVLVSTA
jgi:hypothetical protein